MSRNTDRPRNRGLWTVAFGAATAAMAVFATAAGAAAAPAAATHATTYGHGRASWRFDDTATPMAEVTQTIGADRLWAAGDTGAGVGVALVDTGVVPVPGLASTDVVLGPDLSLD